MQEIKNALAEFKALADAKSFLTSHSASVELCPASWTHFWAQKMVSFCAPQEGYLIHGGAPLVRFILGPFSGPENGTGLRS